MRWLQWTVEEYESLENPHKCKVLVMEMSGDGKYKLITPLKKTSVKLIAPDPLISLI